MLKNALHSWQKRQIFWPWHVLQCFRFFGRMNFSKPFFCFLVCHSNNLKNMWKLDRLKQWQGILKTAFEAAKMKSIYSFLLALKTSENKRLIKRFVRNFNQWFSSEILIKSNKYAAGQNAKLTLSSTQVTCCRNLFPQGSFKRNRHAL